MSLEFGQETGATDSYELAGWCDGMRDGRKAECWWKCIPKSRNELGVAAVGYLGPEDWWTTKGDEGR